MNEGDAGQTGVPPVPEPRTVGETLRATREAQGLSVAEISARTRVPVRHLEAIEAGDYQALPAPTYAVGFARAYARSVGQDEVAVAKNVRAEVNRMGRRQPEYEPYEVADPARVPSRGLAILAAGLALGVLIVAALWFGGDWFRRSAGPQVADGVPVATRPVPAAAPSPSPTPASGGEVVLTARDEVWMRVYDADNATLYLGTLKPGERFVVPAGARDPQINVGRPDQLAITLNGAAVPPLGDGKRAIKDVPIGPAAIAARLNGAAPVPAASATPVADASVPPAFATPAAAPTRARAAERPRPRRVLTETQRANLESARNPPPARRAGGDDR